MHPAKQRAVIPQEFQAALPPGILYQPTHVGGSLGFAGPDAKPGDMWDQLETEAAAPIGPGGGNADLRQELYDFSVEISTVSELILPFNKKRVYLFVQNRGLTPVFVAFGKSATIGSGILLPATSGFYEPILGTVSSVHAIAASRTNTLIVVEGFRA